MEIYIITVRSVTYAQKTVELLRKNGIKSRMVKRPKGLAVGGCGYAAEAVTAKPEELRRILADAALPDFGIYKKVKNGYELL